MDIDLVNQNLAKANLSKIKKQSSDFAQTTLKEKKLKEACAGFEAIFLNTMIKSMRESLPGDGLFNESHGMNIYKSLYDQYLSDELSKSKLSVGIKEFLFEQLKESE
ncbi:MAG: rod-binding protein [Proteobacteria bacterium]|nr:rod-binding protein [Pseudomonadota bacterium]MBU1581176.1 rod-binding protein [Pseudomonadota bacterium]MBU2454581.1 rod-binding protein [Pseudomonadota bacterium]MBU2629857.1 rod-binding protein [Pseudomonadota bacterium]